jgi:hypothetical protein
MRHLLSWPLAGLVLLGTASAVQAYGFGRGGGRAAPAPRGGAAGGYRGGYVGPSGAHTSAARGGSVVGPFGAAAGGARGGTTVTPRGTVIQHGAAGGARVGPYGGAQAGGARGTRVTTPGGRTYTHAEGGRVGVGPGGGVAASGGRGGAAVGLGGAVGGWSRGGVAVGPYGGAVAGRGAVVGHSTVYASPSVLATRATVVRGGHYPYFTRSWYARYPAAWWPTRWAVPSIWVPPVWVRLAPFVGIVATGPPVVYDYGSTVVINDNRVYVDGVETATAEQYAQQALDLAESGRGALPAPKDEWQPLGVFGLIQAEDKVAQQIFQLAVNQRGVVRGNYYNALTEQTQPAYGSVDKKSQRVSWFVGDNKNVVFEAGLYNLTQEQSTALVHYGKDRTIQMVLVRLKEPEGEKGAAGAG